MNTAGVIPPIFASSILVFPATVATFIPSAKNYSALLTPGGWVYNVVYIGLIVFFCYFYTAVTFNPVDVADNLKKYGGFIPGIRPGRFTAEYIDRVLSRITLFGAIYVSIVCVLPTLLIQRFNVPFYFGGTALLIVVGVALDTVAQMETHLLTRNYEGFMRRGRIKSRGEVGAVRLVLLGPPGAGKGTQARMLEKLLHVPQVASGDLVARGRAQSHRLGRGGQALHGQGRTRARRAGAQAHRGAAATSPTPGPASSWTVSHAPWTRPKR